MFCIRISFLKENSLERHVLKWKSWHENISYNWNLKVGYYCFYEYVYICYCKNITSFLPVCKGIHYTGSYLI